MTIPICPPAAVPYLPTGTTRVTLADVMAAERQRERIRKQEAQKTKSNEKHRQYYLAHKTEHRERVAKWEAAHPDNSRIRSLNWYYRRKAQMAAVS